MPDHSDDNGAGENFQATESSAQGAQGVRIPNSLPFEPPDYSRESSLGSGGYDQVDRDLQRLRSGSFSSRFRQVGGVNSIDNFARSWQRAAGFPEILPRRSSVVATDSDDDLATSVGDYHDYRASRLYSQDDDVERPLLGPYGGVTTEDSDTADHGPSKRSFPTASVFGSSFDRSLPASYGTISSRVSQSTRRRAIQFHREQQALIDAPIGSDAEPLLMKQVQHEDGTRENIVIGQSTVPQTIFNSVNVLIGVGLLSLPLAMKQAGWLLGLLFLFFAAVTTAYTAKILTKCLDVDRSLVTYADLAYISFGSHARLVTSLLFCLELIGACVALVVLFADSLHVLVPGLSINQWKIICGVVLLPLNFVPLRFLSVTSILGIISCTSIVIIICIDGLLKPEAPGSLLRPSQTSWFPENWATLPLSFGLIMSPWGGHGVFPNIYKDMRHPQKYGRSLWVTYLFTYSLDCAMAIVGWLMFGGAVRDEITANVLQVDEYPQVLSICIIIFIAIIPVTKVPLNCRPLVATVEVLCRLGPRPAPNVNHRRFLNDDLFRQSSQIAIRILVIAVIVLMAVVFPSFDRIMALMGSALCFTICIILPLAFHLKIFGKEISPAERVLDWCLLISSSILAAVGTAWAFLPQDLISQATTPKPMPDQ